MIIPNPKPVLDHNKEDLKKKVLYHLNFLPTSWKNLFGLVTNGKVYQYFRMCPWEIDYLMYICWFVITKENSFQKMDILYFFTLSSNTQQILIAFPLTNKLVIGFQGKGRLNRFWERLYNEFPTKFNFWIFQPVRISLKQVS